MPTHSSGSDDAARSIHAGHRAYSGGGDAPPPPGPARADAIVLPARLVTATRGDWREELGARADAAIERVTGQDGAEIALDLRATVDVDVSGLGLLVVVRQRARDRGVAVRLLHVAPPIRELMALTRLDALFVFDE